jgi:phosphate transport system ATP-binding protein
MAGPDMAVDTTLTSSPIEPFTLEATGLTSAAAAQLLNSDGANAGWYYDADPEMSLARLLTCTAIAADGGQHLMAWMPAEPQPAREMDPHHREHFPDHAPTQHRPDAPLVVGHPGTRFNRSKVTIQSLDVCFGATRVLKRVSIDLPEHQVTAVIGPSGCGKSTTLRVLNRIYSMYSEQRATGTVLLDGDGILRPDVDRRRLRARVGMVFQEIKTFPMSIYKIVAFGIRLHKHLSRTAVHLQVEEALTRVALWPEVKDRLRDPASALSGGQQQRLCIARALSTQPEVLLLDEPTSALDAGSMMKIENLIDELKCAVTIVLATHNLQQAARCADQVAFIYLSEMIEAGPDAHMLIALLRRRTQAYITRRFG